MRFDKRVKVSESIPASPVLVLSESFVDLYPVLVEYMTTDKFGDGTPRQTSTVTIFAEDGGLKACLNDRDLNRVAFVTGSSAEELLDALEKGLAVEGLDWRAPKKGRGHQKPKKAS